MKNPKIEKNGIKKIYILIVLTAMRETILNAFHEFCWSLFAGQVRARNTSPDNKSRAKMGAFAIGAPFTFWVMDYMGPLPEISSGNKPILVVVDHFLTKVLP